MKMTWKIAHGLLFVLWLCCWCGAPVHAQSQNAQDDLTVLYDQAQKQLRDGNLEVAIATYERILQQDANYRDTPAKLEAVRKQLVQKQRDRFLEERYAEGLSAHKQRDWTRAIIAFEKVVAAEAGYLDARKRLNEAQRELDRESVETIAARYYADGVAAKNRKDLGGALTAFEKVQRLNPRYRNVQTLLAEVEQALSHSAAPAEMPQWPATLPATGVAAHADLDSLYELAAAAARRQDWIAAVVAFEKLQILQPNYRDVAQRLSEARIRLNAGVPSAGAGNTEETPATSIWSWAGGVTLFFVLPLLGVAMFSPNARARYQLFRGN
jgi:tetratricopeptide (TPR) repeat protein